MLRLRAIEPTDLPLLYRWENDSSAWADSSTHNPLSQALLRDYIDSQTGDIYRDGQLRLIIEEVAQPENTAGVTLGCIDLFDFDPANQKAAIGMYIAPEARGRRVGHEAVSLLEQYVTTHLHLHMLYAIIATDNAPCLAIYRRAGYTESAPLADWLRRTTSSPAATTYVAAIVFQKIF